MTDATDYYENNALSHVFISSWTPPSALYVALHTGDPGEDGSANEVTGGSYARVQVDPGAANWTVTANVASNDNDITFPAPTANWGTVSHVSIWDASAAGNCLFKGAVGTAKAVNNGDQAPKITAGSLTITLD